MEEKKSTAVAMRILMALSTAHFINDLLQSIITASYPVLRDELTLSFSQIGLISLVYQIASSVFQPISGIILDKWPYKHSLQIAASFTMVGLVLLSFSEQIPWIMLSVFLVGIGSAITHPECSRIVSLASGGKRGFAQSVFQVGGNLGSSLGPLMVAWLVAPYTRTNIALFAFISILAILNAAPIVKWYGNYLEKVKSKHQTLTPHVERPLSLGHTILVVTLIIVLIFSKYIYMSSLSNYYTFYLMEKFGVSVQTSQICLFIFLFATAAGTLVGGPIGDKIGRKYVIWISILGTAPFSLLMPHIGTTFFAGQPDVALVLTCFLSFCAGFILSSAFPAIIIYSQELLPNALGMISGIFYGFAFGIAGVAAALMGKYADQYGLMSVYQFCSYTPLLGLVAMFLPNLKKRI